MIKIKEGFECYYWVKSIASFLQKVLKIVWIASIFVTCLYAIAVIISLVNPATFQKGPLTVPLAGFSLSLDLDPKHEAMIKPTIMFVTALFLKSFWLIILYQLRKIFASLVRNNPFEASNVRRLQIIAYLAIAHSVTNTVTNFRLSQKTKELIPELISTATAWKIRFQPDFNSLFLGLVILILAELFWQAGELKSETELTV